MFCEFKVDNLETFPAKFKELLDSQRAKIDELANSKSTSYQEVLKPIDDLDEIREVTFAPLSHLNSAMNSKQTQKAYEESLTLLSEFYSDISQNEALFKKLKELKPSTNEQRRVLENEIRDFILSGAELDKDKKQELKEIDLRLSELSNRFSQNLLDATNSYELIIEDEEDIRGLPAEDIKRAEFKEDDKTKWSFTLQIPSYLAYMSYGPNRKLREELYRAYTTRAPQNREVIDEILLLRDKKAKLLGFKNYAEYALKRRDASSSSEVLEFLELLATKSLPKAKLELEELKEFAYRLDGIRDLASYDLAYYSEKLKKELYSFDESDIKPYFELNRVLKGLLDIVSELFSVEFKEVNINTWHPSVRVFDIYSNSKLFGRIYFDLEAREEKRGGAWMQDWESHFIDSKAKEHLASAFVVANFAPAKDNLPSLLSSDNVVTLFHEMGHAIHHLFSEVKERPVSGINGVAWDVVEFPSQFLENFAYEEAILSRFAFHYKSNEPIPKELLKKIKASKNFQSALGMLRQIEFAMFDFKLHLKLYQGDEVQELLDSIRERLSLVKPPSYNRFQYGFSHIFAGGYSAGYYSYKWAEVLSADAFYECVDSKGNFIKERARGYKEHILAKGGAKDMSQLYYEWLGRKPKVESLLKLYEIES